MSTAFTRRRFTATALAAVAAVTLAACGDDGPDSTPGVAAAPGGPGVATTLTVKDPWVKAADSGMTAAFAILVNDTDADITITGVTSPASPMELHEMAMRDGRMVMQPKSGIVVKARSSHELEPGGDHLMLMQPSAPIKPGDQLTFTLALSGGRSVSFTAVAKPFAGAGESYDPRIRDAYAVGDGIGNAVMGDRARPVRRRLLLAGGAGVAVGAAGAAVTANAVTGPTREAPPALAAPAGLDDTGTGTVAFHGPRQAGVATEPPAYASFVAFTLNPGVDRAALGRMMRLLSDDAARLTRGVAPLGDTEPELAVLPARLTVTFGFGPALYTAAARPERRPASVADLPAFPIDRLNPAWTGGDLLIQLCADDPLTVSHAQRMLIKDARPFATVRWVQRGFRRSRGVQGPAHTQRNVLGQLDGTANPRGAALDTAVWVPDGEAWLRGSSTLVVRRIRAEMETWDLLSVTDKEQAVGRRLDTGAPLTGTTEMDEPDLTAVNSAGLPVMPEYAHVTRARVTDDRLKILRRAYNYDDTVDPAGRPDTGLIFASYQADIDRQYLPIQRKLADLDLLNDWTTPIGSAVFAIPPGCPDGGWIGEQILD